MIAAHEAAPSTASSLEQRYGRSRQRRVDRRVGLALGAVLLALIGGVLVFGRWWESSDLEFTVVHYEVVDDRTVTLDFDVTAPSGAPVACAIEALSPSFSTVGWRVLELPESAVRTRSFTETILTTYRATTGRVHSCWIMTAGAE